ncbi:MAG: hypothetical protein ABH881_03890 [bacterium]
MTQHKFKKEKEFESFFCDFLKKEFAISGEDFDYEKIKIVIEERGCSKLKEVLKNSFNSHDIEDAIHEEWDKVFKKVHAEIVDMESLLKENAAHIRERWPRFASLALKFSVVYSAFVLCAALIAQPKLPSEISPVSFNKITQENFWKENFLANHKEQFARYISENRQKLQLLKMSSDKSMEVSAEEIFGQSTSR